MSYLQLAGSRKKVVAFGEGEELKFNHQPPHYLPKEERDRQRETERERQREREKGREGKCKYLSRIKMLVLMKYFQGLLSTQIFSP